MKVKIGQKIRIGETRACVKALNDFYLDNLTIKPVLGRTAVVKELVTFNDLPAVHLKFRTVKPIDAGDIRHPSIYYPVAALRKP